MWCPISGDDNCNRYLVPQIGHLCNELCGDEANPPMRNGERGLLAHQGGLWIIQKAWAYESPKNMHEGHAERSELMLKDQ